MVSNAIFGQQPKKIPSLQFPVYLGKAERSPVIKLFFFQVFLDNKEYFFPYLGGNNEETDLVLQKLLAALLENGKTDAPLELFCREPDD